jgi:hypothetical protein
MVRLESDVPESTGERPELAAVDPREEVAGIAGAFGPRISR